MKTVQEIAREIVAREGNRYTNDPDDSGGPTRNGVTIGRMIAMHLDLNGDGRVTAEDVRLVTPAMAERIFIDEYYTANRLHLLPEPLQASVFDMTVNAGSAGVRILQKLLNGYGAHLTTDGAMGPKTADAAHDVIGRVQNPGLVDAYGIARRDFYYALADARAKDRKYARRNDGGKGGWIRRAEEFISPALHLTEAQHRARVAAWT